MEEKEEQVTEMVDQFDEDTEEPTGISGTDENFLIGGNENISDNEIRRKVKERAYEDDIQHIDNLLRKYQMHTDPIDDEPCVEDEAPYEQESEFFEEPRLSSPCDYEILTEMQSSSSEEPTEQLEIIASDETCNGNVVTSNSSTPEQVIIALEPETSTAKENLETEDPVWKKPFSDNAYLDMEEDVNANRTKSEVSQEIGRMSQWQHHFNEDSATFHIFQVPNAIESGNFAFEKTPQTNEVDFVPGSVTIPDEILNSEVLESNHCDSQLDTMFVKEEPVPEFRPSAYRQSSIKSQINLYTRWHQNLKDAFAPLSCSCCKSFEI